MPSNPERVIRFEVPSAETLERLAVDRLPIELREESSDLDFFRVIFFDTPGRDLEDKGASVRLIVRKDGSQTLSVDVREREDDTAALVHRRSESDVAEVDVAELFDGPSEPARLVRALIDPSRLETAFQLETLRHVRRGRLDGESDAPLEVYLDTVTVRKGEVHDDLHEMEVRVPATEDRRLDGLIQSLERRYDLRVTLADTAARARELLEDLEVDALEREVRAGREVAVIAHDRGRIALLNRSGALLVPTAPGTGADACRRALRKLFGTAQGRIRILGTSAAAGSRPAVDVWLAEGMRRDGPDERGITWLPLDRALAMVGRSTLLRDARTLAALHAAARSDLPGTPSATLSGRSGAEPREDYDRPTLELAIPEPEAITGELPDDVPPEHLLNMELSRMAFDERVLTIAEDPAVPLLERLRFLSMFGSRQDEFFMTRMSKYKERIARGGEGRTQDGLTPGEQEDLIAIRARQMSARAYAHLSDVLLPALAEHDIHVVAWDDLEPGDRQWLEDNYFNQAAAVLTPLASDTSHPFPHIRNLRPAIAANVRHPESRVEHFVAMELPGGLPRFVRLPDGRRFVPLEEIILASLPHLYSGLEVVRAHTFRVTRSAYALIDEDDVSDVLQAVEEAVTQRPFRAVVRLEVEDTMPADMRDHILTELQYEAEEWVSTLSEADVYPVNRLVDLHAFEELVSVEEDDLLFDEVEHALPFPTHRPVMELLDEADRLVHFPYDSFDQTVERFLEEAADDPDVIAIKITLYRTNRSSKVVEALARARDNGKEAVALVELKARFDERQNIDWARSLERAGIHVVYSPPKLKVHAKVAQVVRQEEDGIRRYVYMGTGNLNASTATSYVDLGVLTADQELGAELNALFNVLTGYSASTDFTHLLVAPFNMKRRFLEMIEREIEHAGAGREARITAQMNGLSDPDIVGALYRASREGVKIDLAVREICTLRPGVPGLSDNIRIVSLLGRFLQHARIFRFRNGGEPEYYIGSADWRPRNLERRIELITPVRSREHRARLDEILEETLENPNAWALQPDGAYVRNGEVVGGGESMGIEREPRPESALRSAEAGK